MSEPLYICEVCRVVLGRQFTEDGVSLIHEPGNLPEDGHEPRPIPMPEGYTGKCDFCSEDPPEYRFPVRAFRYAEVDNYASEGDWSACRTCMLLVEGNRWNTLLRRALAAQERRHGVTTPPEIETSLRKMYRQVRENITGAAKPLHGED